MKKIKKYEGLKIPEKYKENIEAMLDYNYLINNLHDYNLIRKVVVNLGLTIQIRNDGSHRIIRIKEIYIKDGEDPRAYR